MVLVVDPNTGEMAVRFQLIRFCCGGLMVVECCGCAMMMVVVQ